MRHVARQSYHPVARSARRAAVQGVWTYRRGMDFEFNEDALAGLGEQVAKAAEEPLDRGVQLAQGEPLDIAAMIFADQLEAAGFEPNLDGVRAQLVGLAWNE